MDQPALVDRRIVMDIHSSLMSPPEAVGQDSFSTPSTADEKEKTFQPGSAPFHGPLSPPVSPLEQNGMPESAAVITRDPILFPTPDVPRSASSQPLFFDPQSQQVVEVVEEHVQAREARGVSGTASPAPAEYRLTLEFAWKMKMVHGYSADPGRWHRRELAFLKSDTLRRNEGNRRYPTLAPASNPPRRTAVRGNGNGTRVNAKGAVARPSVRTPKARQATPDHGPKKVAREDKKFQLLPDFSPPTNTLPNKPNCLKVEWKGAPIDLKDDPHRGLLHQEELLLASILRLDCATYLTNKRRLFIQRIEAYKIGKEFRKTDAQQACKIDVNKASKLWSVYEKVGWLDMRHFQKYL
ncbi:putative SWIRM domain-containing protein [Amylocarpus encephaloides]|uniref:SWIRM domain-containing protein n=1 Tax=Amylocarpus encephaloides TaxID=45428 RepID=A0A9P7YR25_9HELO|nr:putative SWIRM domain-containing protein [Amylocarpus encephaloides]